MFGIIDDACFYLVLDRNFLVSNVCLSDVDGGGNAWIDLYESLDILEKEERFVMYLWWVHLRKEQRIKLEQTK